MFPVGTVLPFGGAIVPASWLLCDGSAVSRTTYASLFSLIGTTYGSGDGSTTFNVPDLRSRTVLGAGSGSGLTPRALGATGGEEEHTLSQSELPAHVHSGSVHTHTAGPHTHWLVASPIPAGQGFFVTNSFPPNEDVYAQPGSYDLQVLINQQTGPASGNYASQSFDFASVGGGSAHENLQPFLALNYIILSE